MFSHHWVLLPNAHGHVTEHMLIRLARRSDAIYPIFACINTNLERVYGCLRPDVSDDELEQLFGPIDYLDDTELAA